LLPRANGPDDMFRITRDAVNLRRGCRVLEMQADEIESWFLDYNPTLVHGLPFSKHREIDPREAWVEPGAPDNVGHL
jgi:hypothetical protein